MWFWWIEGYFGLDDALVFSEPVPPMPLDAPKPAMLAQKNIIENAVNSKDHITLVAAVKAAGLVDTLEGKGPFAVFAPDNGSDPAMGRRAGAMLWPHWRPQCGIGGRKCT